MVRIFKYDLEVDGICKIINGRFKQILDIQIQNGKPKVWILLDDDCDIKSWAITAIGTGWEMDIIPGKYVGTVQDNCGYVWHYFLEKLK